MKVVVSPDDPDPDLGVDGVAVTDVSGSDLRASGGGPGTLQDPIGPLVYEFKAKQRNVTLPLAPFNRDTYFEKFKMDKQKGAN